MRKLSAIALLILFASTNEVGQLLKFPLLISHYIDHFREENQSVYAFFHEHYVHHHGTTNKDRDEDDQLPFKTISVQQLSAAYVLPAFQIIHKPSIPEGEKKLVLPSTFILTNYLKDIFHPPQIV
jgi:hypothetical protein